MFDGMLTTTAEAPHSGTLRVEPPQIIILTEQGQLGQVVLKGLPAETEIHQLESNTEHYNDGRLVQATAALPFAGVAEGGAVYHRQLTPQYTEIALEQALQAVEL